jgi:hypothetical protein
VHSENYNRKENTFWNSGVSQEKPAKFPGTETEITAKMKRMNRPKKKSE